MLVQQQLMEKRDVVLRIASQHGAHDVRIFGSVARGTQNADSDLDLLVRLDPDRSLLDRIELIQELEDCLHCKVDVVNEQALHPQMKDRVLREAITL